MGCPCGRKLEGGEGVPEVALGKQVGEGGRAGGALGAGKGEQSWVEEGARVLAVTQGLQVPEVLPGLPARGPPPSASMSVWIQGQVGEGRVGEPGVLLQHYLPPNRTSPLRASEFSVR